MSKNKKRVIVIGGGVAGLATAALLGKDGYQVTICEKNEQLGGRARVYQEGGFTFDMGPSWYMMPDVFDDFFALFGKKVSDFYDLKRLQNHYTVFFDGGRCYPISSDMRKNTELFEKTEPGAGSALLNFLKTAEFQYKFAMKDLVLSDYTNLSSYLKPSLLFNLYAMNLHKSFHSHVSNYFKNKDLQKILEFTTVFLGGSPYNTPAFYSLIAHTDFNLGIWYPDGGMNMVVQSLVRLCQDHNVSLKTSCPVTSLVFEANTITGVRVGGKEIQTDHVVSTADYPHTEMQLIPSEYQTYSENYWQKKTLAPSAFLIYLGLNKKLNGVFHHNLYFNDTWEKHFKTVYTNPQWPNNPSYYVHCPTKSDDSVAPKGAEQLIFLVPVSAGLTDTESTRDQFSKQILKHFQQLIGQNFEKNIVVKRIFAHRDFESDYNAYKGAAFGIAHTLLQTALFRPRNRSRKIKNLFYAGQYTNPGVGVPVCLLSAQIVRNLLLHEE